MRRILTSLVAVLSISSVQAQLEAPETPKLVVNINVDQLRGDYLDFFQSNFGERGFRRLMRDGLVYQNMVFDFPQLNNASALATIFTGANPFYSGISGNQKYIRDKGLVGSVFADDFYLGNYTQEKLSPLALRVSTIGDELKKASQGKSDVYSLAPDADEALITAGRNGNCAFWLENYSGKWATSTYYKDFHWVVDQINRSDTSYSRRVGTMVWKPLLAIDKYKAFPYTTNIYPFQHTFGYGKDSYQLFKESPFVNDAVTNTALALIDKAALGKRTFPDLISLTYYAGNYSKSVDKSYSIELQDTYCRLDRDLAKLLDGIDRTVGLKNTLFVITSTGYYLAEEPNSDVNSQPTVFYVNRCESLLNMYLMAIYGREQWVEGFFNNQIYLNRKLIESKNLNLKEIQQKAAEFVIQFTGVQDVATNSQLLLGEENSSMSGYRNLLVRENSGDIFIQLQPGIKVVDEKETTLSPSKDYRVRNTAVPAPAIFFGYDIKPQKINRTINAREIAPTVSHILRIRSPNASSANVLNELIRYK